MVRNGVMRQFFIVKLESYDGCDTFVHCGSEDQNYIYCVVCVTEDGDAEIVDTGYRSFDEAEEAWPEAGSQRPRSIG